ncbi:unnamed protein product [Echinostoma caproni]|uniref:Cadherin domain-containing protein n=1 Tax=Echinostoma caproni TaxID=27848 RepID=A0A183AEF8_9TREM|nr:unnamed protein product [Echinostoma caproni]
MRRIFIWSFLKLEELTDLDKSTFPFLNTVNNGPQFSQEVYYFVVNTRSVDNVVGTLHATDLDDLSVECGRLQFVLPGTSTNLMVDPNSGVVLLNTSYTSPKLPQHVVVMVQNPAPFDQLTDTAIILLTNDFSLFQIDIGFSEMGPFGVSEKLRRSKRQTIAAPTATTITLARFTPTSSIAVCPGCYWVMKIMVYTKSGLSSPNIEIYGPAANFVPMGYIQDVTTTIGIMCANIATSATAGFVLEDFAFEINYKVVVKTTATNGTRTTVGASLSALNSVYAGYINLTVGPPLQPSLFALNCPTSPVFVGSVLKLSYSLFAPLQLADYSFIITSSSGSVSIQDASATFGTAFIAQPGLLTKNRWDRYQTRTATTNRMEISIFGMNNTLAWDAAGSQSAESVTIDVYAQVSPLANSFASVEVIAGFPQNLQLSATCALNISARANAWTQNPAVVLTSTAPAGAIDTYKSENTTIRLDFPPNSVQSYYVEVEMQQTDVAEFGYAIITQVGSSLTSFIAGVS